MWVLDHLDDIASDMSVFHRVDDIYSMTGRRFFTLANRLAAYKGVLRARIEAEEAKRAERRGGGGARTKLSQMVRRDPETGAMSVTKVGESGA